MDTERRRSLASRAQRAMVNQPKFNAALVLALVIQGAGVVWWAARQQIQLEHVAQAATLMSATISANNEKIDSLRFNMPNSRDFDRIQSQLKDIEARVRSVERAASSTLPGLRGG